MVWILATLSRIEL